MAMKIDLKNVPSWAKGVITVVPSAIVAALVVFLLVMPKQKQIREFEGKIDKQNNEIAASQAKAARLDILKQENDRLLKRLEELKEQLPEEREITSLLKQVSDLGIGSGLEIKSWKPGQKIAHPSGIVEEIPVSVEFAGTYHDLGAFLSSLTRLNRIVNINDMKLTPQTGKAKGGAVPGSQLGIAFKASTFSAVPEQEMKLGESDTTSKGKAGQKVTK